MPTGRSKVPFGHIREGCCLPFRKAALPFQLCFTSLIPTYQATPFSSSSQRIAMPRFVLDAGKHFTALNHNRARPFPNSPLALVKLSSSLLSPSRRPRSPPFFFRRRVTTDLLVVVFLQSRVLDMGSAISDVLEKAIDMYVCIVRRTNTRARSHSDCIPAFIQSIHPYIIHNHCISSTFCQHRGSIIHSTRHAVTLVRTISLINCCPWPKPRIFSEFCPHFTKNSWPTNRWLCSKRLHSGLLFFAEPLPQK